MKIYKGSIGATMTKIVKITPPLFVLICAIFLTFPKSVLAESPFSQTVKPKAMQVAASLLLPALDLNALRSKAFQRSPEKVLKFAQVHEYAFDASVSDGWTNVDDGGQQTSVWRLRIDSPNAYSINLGFSKYTMPEGGKLFIYAEGYENVVGPFTAEDNEEHGQLWTPIIPSNVVFVEVNIPTDKVDQLELELFRVNQAYLDLTKLYEEARSLKSGSCNYDVVCPEGDAWRDQIQSVAAYSTGGNLFCTGAAINNTANNKRPFFLTARHCGIDRSNAASVVAYWNFQNSTCRASGSAISGAAGDGQLSQFNSGAIFRASYYLSDMTLIEFDDPVPIDANVYLSGWNRADDVVPSVVAIHHPNVDEKRISFENDPVSISAYLKEDGSGVSHIRVADWDLGTTEPGSSGSPIYDPERRIVGQLHGGFAACGNDEPDWYGRINISWDGRDTDSSGLKSWLDPISLGSLAIDGIPVNDTSQGPGFSVTATDALEGQDENVLFTITLDEPQPVSVGYDFITEGGTAVDGEDYLSLSGRAIFPAGVTVRKRRVSIIDDGVSGEIDETFSLIVTDINNPVAMVAAEATIRQNIMLPVLSGGDVRIEENVGRAVVEFNLSAASTEEVRVRFETFSPQAARNPAEDGSDYIGRAGTIIFQPGQTRKTRTITLVDDTVVEANELFRIDLSGVLNATMDPNSERNRVFIVNDD